MSNPTEVVHVTGGFNKKVGGIPKDPPAENEAMYGKNGFLTTHILTAIFDCLSWGCSDLYTSLFWGEIFEVTPLPLGICWQEEIPEVLQNMKKVDLRYFHWTVSPQKKRTLWRIFTHDPRAQGFRSFAKRAKNFPSPTFGAPDERFGQLALLVRASHGYLVVTWRSGHTKLIQ